MRLKGVSYDAGRFMGINWRPNFDPKVVHRELEIIKNDLHCNAVRVCARDIGRLMTTAEDALDQGLEVWLSPELWDKGEPETIQYLSKAAESAERLRQRWPERLVFIVGSEATLFMQGILPGKNITKRLGSPDSWARLKAGEHNQPLNAFLSRANEVVRKDFHGRVTYASIIWEKVDWNLFDFVGIDHYRAKPIEDRYIEMLKPLFAYGKPVVITEFGFATFQSEKGMAETLVGGGDVDSTSQFLHQLPIVGRLVRPRMRTILVRDEGWQARQLADTLGLLDDAGVEGTFVFQFLSQINPCDVNPKHDLDVASTSLVKTLPGGMRGTTYSDMNWEPKESFQAVADYYAKH